MKIKQIEINNFRGIKELEWKIESDFICLIGPGDSTKSTILDAIEFALSSRWNLLFSDNDFFNLDTKNEIQIAITLTGIPDELLIDSKFGLHLRGWNHTDGLRDEPFDGDLKALTIQLKVNSSLEPEWNIINARSGGIKISGNDRNRFSVARLGEFVDRHLTWGKGTILTRITKETDNFSGILPEIGRTTRASISLQRLPELQEAAKEVQILARRFGIASKGEYAPHIDMQALNPSVGSITLHDNNVPLRLSGSGTKRLLAIAMQNKHANEKGGITIVDELEHGLEPHRIRKLISELRENNSASQEEAIDQIFITTHHPVVITELKAKELHIVRNGTDPGRIFVSSIDQGFQDIVRKVPEAFLGRSILVCEGKTELGICKKLDEKWSSQNTQQAFSYKGIIPVFGSGHECAKIASRFHKLGYKTALFCDSDDRNLDAKILEFSSNGGALIRWNESCSTEERLISDLPWEGVIKIVNFAMESNGSQSVTDKINAHLQYKLSGSPDEWKEEASLRIAIGKAASDKKPSQGNTSSNSEGQGWFKRIDYGEFLGDIILEYMDDVKDKDLGLKIQSLQKWVQECG